MWGWREQHLSFWMKTYARHPQTQRWETSGLHLYQASWGVMPLREDVGRCIWAVRASSQSEGGNLASNSIADISSAMVLFAFSVTPFCCGLFWVVWCLWMPHSSVNLINVLDMYSGRPNWSTEKCLTILYRLSPMTGLKTTVPNPDE